MDASIIAKNRYDKPIALSLGYDLYKRPAFGQKPSYISASGRVLLLPPPTKIGIRDGINLILEDVYGIQQVTPPPIGIDDVLLPGEIALAGEINERLIQIQTLRLEIESLEKNMVALTNFKQLLYETGDRLENICKKTLIELGGSVSDSAEDFLLTWNQREAVVEVKGKEGPIERKDGSQLAQNRRNYAVSKGKAITDIKAILLGNPHRLLFPIEERLKRDLFAPRLIDDCKVENLTAVTSVDLFKAYCMFLDGKISGSEIIEKLFSGVGYTKLIKETSS